MNEAARKKLWDDYAKQSTPELREKLILEYAPLVKVVAGRLSMYFGYNVEFDDLVSYGVFGLIDAVDKFDTTKDVKFETYASLRIRGAILDHIRKMDWMPRTIRQHQRQIEDAMKELEAKNNRAATDAEIAEYIGISEDEYFGWKDQLKADTVVSLNEYIEQGGSDIPSEKRVNGGFDTPEMAVEQQELKGALTDALGLLTEKERNVILLYYYEELTLKEISCVLNVSESRVSQLHTKALQKMKTKMANYMGLLNV
jgi:RNA polymerase sigma factor for flagellar operon FliA